MSLAPPPFGHRGPRRTNFGRGALPRLSPLGRNCGVIELPDNDTFSSVIFLAAVNHQRQHRISDAPQTIAPPGARPALLSCLPSVAPVPHVSFRFFFFSLLLYVRLQQRLVTRSVCLLVQAEQRGRKSALRREGGHL